MDLSWSHPVASLQWLATMSLAMAGVVRADAPDKERPAPLSPNTWARTAFLGDSITDGYTYPQLVRDSLVAARKPRMVAICAGIGGDTIKGMRARLDRDVLGFRPTLVTVSSGGNDAARGVPPADYAADMRAVVEALRKRKIPVLLLTPSMAGPANKASQATLDAYEAEIRRLAAEFRLRVAEINQCQKAARAAGRKLFATDGIHPDYEGQRMIARAVLDAMGYANVPVVERAAPRLDAGVIPEWKIRAAAPDEKPLSEASVASVRPDQTWATIRVPQPTSGIAPDDLSELWLDDCRQQGVVVGLNKFVAPGSRFVAVATLVSKQDRTAQLHTGADLLNVWVNGQSVYTIGNNFRGWHAGRESVPVQLRKGDNTIVAETGANFYLSVTDGPMW